MEAVTANATLPKARAIPSRLANIKFRSTNTWKSVAHCCFLLAKWEGRHQLPWETFPWLCKPEETKGHIWWNRKSRSSTCCLELLRGRLASYFYVKTYHEVRKQKNRCDWKRRWGVGDCSRSSIVTCRRFRLWNTCAATIERDWLNGTFLGSACSGSTNFLRCTSLREIVPLTSESVRWKVFSLNFLKHPLNLKTTFLVSKNPKNFTVFRTVELEPSQTAYLTAKLSLKTDFGSLTLSDAVTAGIRSFPNSETRLKLAHFGAHFDFRAEHWMVIEVRWDSLTDATIVSIR